jgi:hypothetical protein
LWCFLSFLNFSGDLQKNDSTKPEEVKNRIKNFYQELYAKTDQESEVPFSLLCCCVLLDVVEILIFLILFCFVVCVLLA